jgi:hypothetical protein
MNGVLEGQVVGSGARKHEVVAAAFQSPDHPPCGPEPTGGGPMARSLNPSQSPDHPITRSPDHPMARFNTALSSSFRDMLTNAIQCQLSVTSYPQLANGSQGPLSQPDFKWEMSDGRVVNCRWCVVSCSGAGTLLDFRWPNYEGNGNCSWSVAGCKGPQAGNN